MAAAPSFQRGYRWKGKDDEPSKRWRGEGGNSIRPTAVTGGGVLADTGGQLSGERGKDKEGTESRDSRLVEIANNSVIAINGNQFRMGDLIPDFSQNLNLTGTRDESMVGLFSKASSGSGTRAVVSLGCSPKKAQVENKGILNHGIGSGNLGGPDKAGPLFSFGSPQAMIKEVGLESKDSNQLVEVQVFNGSETEKFPSSNSVRVLPTSLRGKPRGTKQGPVNKRQTSQRGARRGGDGGGAVSQNCGK
ncbi:hypothetical protein RHGRI_008126 [Rhododendron griersonianum]|uniref:Uncharacterized protein n=1 Tax=Rhododendron griersonianum TaxID=479676 RepID=A0AAV6L079_9ERIC|nr:hypothetical protein RHGRI_008126 [Rhododendron griersonianum]